MSSAGKASFLVSSQTSFHSDPRRVLYHESASRVCEYAFRQHPHPLLLVPCLPIICTNSPVTNFTVIIDVQGTSPQLTLLLQGFCG